MLDKSKNRGSLSGQQLTSSWMRFCHQSKLFQRKEQVNRKRSKEGKKELMSNVISHAWIVSINSLALNWIFIFEEGKLIFC